MSIQLFFGRYFYISEPRNYFSGQIRRAAYSYAGFYINPPRKYFSAKTPGCSLRLGLIQAQDRSVWARD